MFWPRSKPIVDRSKNPAAPSRPARPRSLSAFLESQRCQAALARIRWPVSAKLLENGIRLDYLADDLPQDREPLHKQRSEQRGEPMPSFTLDTNCLAEVDEDRPVQSDVLRMIEAARRGEADIAILASNASEHPPGGTHLNRFADFQKRMLAIGLGHITLLKPIARHGLSFHGFGIMSDEAAVGRERLIFTTLFPTTPSRWSDFAAINGLDKKDLLSAGAWKWRNCLGAAQAFWSHENAKRDVFVTTDGSFWRLRNKAEFADAVVMTPTQAVQMLASRQALHLRVRGT